MASDIKPKVVRQQQVAGRWIRAASLLLLFTMVWWIVVTGLLLDHWSNYVVRFAVMWVLLFTWNFTIQRFALGARTKPSLAFALITATGGAASMLLMMYYQR